MVEAAMGLRRTRHGGPVFAVVGIKGDGMKRYGSFGPGSEKGVLSTLGVRLGHVLLLGEMERPIHEDV